MQLDQLKSNIKNKFAVELLIVPKGLMPDVDYEIMKNGLTTIEIGNWVKINNYLVI